MPTLLSNKGYRPRVATVNSARAIHVIWHTGSLGAVEYRRVTAAAPASDVAHEFETGGSQRYGRVAAASDNPTSNDASKERVYVVWADKSSSAGNRLTLALSKNGGVTFDAPKALTKPHVSMRQLVIKAVGKYAYIAFEGDRRSGEQNPRAIWVGRTRDAGLHWEFQRLDSAEPPAFLPSTADDPFEIDLAIGAAGKFVAVVFPYVKSVTQGSLTYDVGGVTVGVSRDYGRSFSYLDVQPPSPASGTLPGNPGYHRARLAMDARDVVHVTWQSTSSWSGAHLRSVTGMLLYRRIYAPDLRVIPPVEMMPCVHPWEAWLPEPDTAFVGGELVSVTFGGAFENYSMAASTKWCMLAYSKGSSVPSPTVAAAAGWPVAGAVASSGHRVAAFETQRDLGVFGIPLAVAGERYPSSDLGPFALAAIPKDDTPVFATVAVEYEINISKPVLLVAIFSAKAQRGEFATPAPTLLRATRLVALKPGETAIAQIHADMVEPKALVVLWQHRIPGVPLPETFIAVSRNEGLSFS